MNIVCAICTEFFKPNEEIYSVPCGHIYHHECVTQWLVRSPSCPECRQETARSAVRRVFFNFSPDDSMKKDCTVLQATVEKLKFQASLRNEELRECRAQNEMLRKKVKNLKIHFEISKILKRSMELDLTRAIDRQAAMREYTEKIQQYLTLLHKLFSTELAYQRKIEILMIQLEGFAAKAKYF